MWLKCLLRCSEPLGDSKKVHNEYIRYSRFGAHTKGPGYRFWIKAPLPKPLGCGVDLVSRLSYGPYGACYGLV